jgi:thymidylate synthase
MDYGTETSVDQIANLINDLKTNPDSRRLMVSAWNVGELGEMVLPPCHYGFQCYVRDGKYLSLMWNQRSVDTFLGLPFNIASYALLLTIIAKEVNMIPEELIGNLGDTHLYLNHIEQAKEQIERDFYELPTLKHLKEDSFYESLSKDQSLYSHLDNTDFELVNYQSHPAIKAPLSN